MQRFLFSLVDIPSHFLLFPVFVSDIFHFFIFFIVHPSLFFFTIAIERGFFLQIISIQIYTCGIICEGDYETCRAHHSRLSTIIQGDPIFGLKLSKQ